MSLRVYLSNEANQGGKVGEGKGTGERQANGETRGKCLGKWSEISPMYCMISMMYKHTHTHTHISRAWHDGYLAGLPLITALRSPETAILPREKLEGEGANADRLRRLPSPASQPSRFQGNGPLSVSVRRRRRRRGTPSLPKRRHRRPQIHRLPWKPVLAFRTITVEGAGEEHTSRVAFPETHPG